MTTDGRTWMPEKCPYARNKRKTMAQGVKQRPFSAMIIFARQFRPRLPGQNFELYRLSFASALAPNEGNLVLSPSALSSFFFSFSSDRRLPRPFFLLRLLRRCDQRENQLLLFPFDFYAPELSCLKGRKVVIVVKKSFFFFPLFSLLLHQKCIFFKGKKVEELTSLEMTK